MNVSSFLRWPVAGVLLALSAVAVLRAAELSGQDKAMMIEAARADLYAQLARQIKGLNVDETTLVANHATEDSSRHGSVEALVRGANVGEPQFLEDVCVIAGSITVEQVVENLRATRREFANGSSTGFESIKRFNEAKTISAQGLGTRRSPGGGRAEESVAAAPADDGMKATLAALRGSGQEKLGAVEAARIDALAQLARQIKGVRISDDSLIYNMALDGRWTETSSSALVSGAQALRYTAMEGELVSCVMSITMQQVVENVQRQRTEFANGSVTSLEKISRYNPALITITATGYGAVGKGRMAPAAAPGRIIGSVQ
jgi:hypothetical protein